MVLQSDKKELSTEDADIDTELQLKFNLKESWAQQRKGMFKITPGGYVFDRLIFNISMFLIFGFLFFVAYSSNFSLDYYSCTEGGFNKDNSMVCKNPFYKPASWVNQQYLPPGEYGTKPGFLFNSMGYITGFLLVGAFVLNHFIYNNKKKEVK